VLADIYAFRALRRFGQFALGSLALRAGQPFDNPAAEFIGVNFVVPVGNQQIEILF
jgi:hypothetical protein